MTNEEMRKLLDERQPSLEIMDYRPLDKMYIPKHTQGIIAYAKNGDIFIYFPKTEFENHN